MAGSGPSNSYFGFEVAKRETFRCMFRGILCWFSSVTSTRVTTSELGQLRRFEFFEAANRMAYGVWDCGAFGIRSLSVFFQIAALPRTK